MGEGKILEILDPSTIAFLLLAGFIAAFIDSTVGGGGLISTPALLALGLPVNFALGTNKLAASMGGLMSVFSFWRAGKINQKVAISLMPLSFLGSALGAYVVYLLPEQLMKNVIVVLLVAVAVYTYRRKDWGDVSAVKQLGLAALLGSVVMAFGIGFYDGFFGPGTGSLFIFAIVRWLGYDFLHASAAARILCIGSGLSALAYFAWQGHIYWPLALPLALANMAGGWLGTHLALRHGAGFVRWFFILGVSFLVLKMVYPMQWSLPLG